MVQFLPLINGVLSASAPPLALREVVEQDQTFIDALYFDCREDLRAFSTDRQIIEPLIQMQQRLQQVGFRTHYPNAQYWIMQSEAAPIGRMVVDVGLRDLRVADIAIATAARRKGAGRAVLRALQEVAQAQQRGVSLASSKTNPAAQALYRSLGFTVMTQDELVEQMVWRPVA